MLEIWWSVEDSGPPSFSDGYSVFSALCAIDLLKHAEPNTQVRMSRDGLLIRCDAAAVGALLAGMPAVLAVGNRKVRIGPSIVKKMLPSPRLFSAFVTIKNAVDSSQLIESATRQLGIINVTAKVSVIGRKVMRIRSNTIVGFGVRLDGLSEADSLTVQRHGLGGRQRMGAGIFLPC